MRRRLQILIDSILMISILSISQAQGNPYETGRLASSRCFGPEPHREEAMQFYSNGYKPGDPFIEAPHPSVAERPEGLPEEADVLIVGCGPAGLVLAAQLANFPDIKTVVIDRKDGPLEVGQADGVACRTVELFEAFGLADRLINEGYWVNEVAFWRPDPQDRTKIIRTGRIQDVEDGLSEM